MNEQDEAIVRRFALQEEDYIEVDNSIAPSQWGASKEQVYEFQIAFEIVGEGAKKIGESQVNDLFLAIGYTLQDVELEMIFERCVRGDDGMFTCDGLVEAYDWWKKDFLEEKWINAVYHMLAEKGKILPKIPIEYVNTRKGLPSKNMMVDKAALKSVIGQVIYQDPSCSAITDDDVLGLVDEVACTAKGTENPKDPYITWNDFAHLFKR